MSNHFDSTFEWYIKWLEERYPAWTPEQRLEIAKGFATTQQPPSRPPEEEEDEAIEQAQKDMQKLLEERKNRRYLTGEELMKILATPGEVKKPS